ncbi:MAG: TolC family protein [Bernardetiaceae bacterium]
MKPYLCIQLICLLFLHVHVGQAQPQTQLDLAGWIDEALKNSRWIKNDNLLVEIAKKQEKYAFDLPKTEINIQYGRINSPYPNDRIYEISQRFSFPALWAARKQWYQSRTQAQTYSRNLHMAQVKRQIRLAYYEWYNNLQKITLLAKQDSLLQSIEKITILRKDVGETDALSAQLLALERQQIFQERTSLELIQEDIIHTLRILATNGNDDFYPRMGKLDSLPIQSFILDNHPEQKYLQASLDVSNAQIGVARQLRLPEFRIRYANMSFEGDQSFSYGIWQVGIALPLFSAGYKADIVSAKITNDVMMNKKQMSIDSLQSSYYTLLQKQELLQNYLRSYTEEQRPTLEKIRHLAQQQYQSGQADYLSVAQANRQIIAMEYRYLAFFKQFYQQLTEILFLIEP